MEQMNGEQILEGLRAEAMDIWRFLDRRLRVLRRRTVDEDTNLAIKRAFPDMTEADCKIKRVDGKTLRSFATSALLHKKWPDARSPQCVRADRLSASRPKKTWCVTLISCYFLTSSYYTCSHSTHAPKLLKEDALRAREGAEGAAGAR